MNTDQRIRDTILAMGGIRQCDHRDSGLTGRENRRLHGYLDRADGEDMDVVAAIIGEKIPESGIYTSDDLAEYLADDRPRADYLAEYERQTEPEEDPEQWQWIDQAERGARAMRAMMAHGTL